MSEATIGLLKAVLISFSVGVVLTCAVGMAIHIFKKKARTLAQVERERVSKVLARLVGSVNNLFFTYRLGDAEFGMMERECRELLGSIDDEIQKHSSILDSGYVSLVSHYAEDKREQLVNMRHDLEIRRHQDATIAQQQASIGSLTSVNPVVAPTAYPPQSSMQRGPSFGAPSPAPVPTPAPFSAPLPMAAPVMVAPVMAAPVQQQGFAQPPVPPQPMYERAIPTQPTMPVYTSSLNKPREDGDEGSMSFADFAAAMREEPTGQTPQFIAGDSPSSASDSWTIKSTLQPASAPQTMAAPSMMQPPVPPQPTPMQSMASQQFMAPPAPVAQPIPVPPPVVMPEVKTTMIPSQPAVSHDVEATQEFTLQDIMQQASRRNEVEDTRGGMISGDDVANKLDALFG